MSKTHNKTIISLSDLVDDTLRHIINNLPNKDKVDFALVCKRFYYLTLDELKHEYLALDFKLPMINNLVVKDYVKVNGFRAGLLSLFDNYQCRINTHENETVLHIYTDYIYFDDKSVTHYSLHKEVLTPYKDNYIVCMAKSQLSDISVQNHIMGMLNKCTTLRISCCKDIGFTDELISLMPNLNKIDVQKLVKLRGIYPKVKEFCVRGDAGKYVLRQLLHTLPSLDKIVTDLWYMTDIFSIGIEPGHNLKHVHINYVYKDRGPEYDVINSQVKWRGKPKIDLITIRCSSAELNDVDFILGHMFSRVKVANRIDTTYE